LPLNTNSITYTLEVSENYKFISVNPDMKASGITQTSHSLNLPPGTYYWRVKAVDGSGNESEWANSLYAFNVGLLPPWVLILGGIVYIVVFYLLVRLLLRRRRNQYPYYY
jgi:predicted phage tail protein